MFLIESRVSCCANSVSMLLARVIRLDLPLPVAAFHISRRCTDPIQPHNASRPPWIAIKMMIMMMMIMMMMMMRRRRRRRRRENIISSRMVVLLSNHQLCCPALSRGIREGMPHK